MVENDRTEIYFKLFYDLKYIIINCINIILCSLLRLTTVLKHNLVT